jgi:hypothetical protein
LVIKGGASFALLGAVIWATVYLLFAPLLSTGSGEEATNPRLAAQWEELSGGRRGKVVFARPPDMFILNLSSGLCKKVPGLVVGGAPGRRTRGLSPRPSWSLDGERFLYRFDGRVYVATADGHRREIVNPLMDTSKETRWSWLRLDGRDWAVGPSTDGDVIMVGIEDPTVIRTAYDRGDVKWWCEITGNGRYVVVDNDRDVYVAPVGRSGERIKISERQSCRPCAAPDNRVAWLPAPHTRYLIFDAATGQPLPDLLAPPGEEIYRLNWSNHPDFAVHMYGSAHNLRMTVRRVSDGGSVFIGHGWDPDLWVD